MAERCHQKFRHSSTKEAMHKSKIGLMHDLSPALNFYSVIYLSEIDMSLIYFEIWV